MLVDVCVHNVSASLQYELGSGSAAAVRVTLSSHGLSVLDLAFVHLTVEP
jgi:hypothetical protein